MPRWTATNEVPGFVAGAAHTSTPFFSLMQSTGEGTCVVSTANTNFNLVGVSRNQPASGEGQRLLELTPGKIVPMIASAAINAFVEVSPDAAGQITTNDSGSGDVIVGISQEAAGNANEIIGVLIQIRTQE